MNVFNVIENHSKAWGNKNAIIHNGKTITYDSLLKKANQLKELLVKNGVTKGCAIAIIFPNGIDFITSLMAATATNALVMPIYHQQKEQEIEDALKNGQIHYYLSKDENLAKFSISSIPINLNGVVYFLYKTALSINYKTAAFVDNPAFMRFTSGTTGEAKGVVISHQAVIERVDSANEALQLSEKDTVLWVLPMAFHFVVSIVLYLKYGTTIVINDSFLAKDMIDNMIQHRVTFLYGSPMQIKLLGAYNEKVILPSLKTVISTTTAISAAICNTFYNKYNVPVSQAYGIIEIGLPIINTDKSATTPDAVGFCLPAYRVGILDEKSQEVNDNTIGLLGIKGPGMFSGYLTPETVKEQVLVNGWFLTGDYAIRSDEGLITIKGREKNVINVAGNKVFPYEVEAIVNNYEGIITSKAYSKNHLLLGEIVALDIVKFKDANIAKEALINYTRNYLSDYKIPQEVNFVTQIKMTASGKIKRG